MIEDQTQKELMTYRFSFVGAHALISEFIKLGKLVHGGANIYDIDASFLGAKKKETYRRKFRELKHRIQQLTTAQLEILADGTYDQQVQMTHIALCKTYQIYKDFVSEILADKVQLYDYTITDLDYNTFISQKKVDHPELDELAHTTQYKVKQVIFRMLEQVELIDSSKNPTLQIPTLDSKVELAVLQDNPTLLTCFFYDDARIQSLT